MSGSKEQMREEDRRGASGWIFAYGLLLMAIGIIALARPLATGLATGLFIAFLLLAGGVAGLVAGFSGRGWRSNWLDAVTGLLSLLLGLLVLADPFAGALSLVWMIGLWLLLVGAFELVAAMRSSTHRGLLALLGALDVLLGIGLLLVGPVAALMMLAVMVGVSFLFRGAFLVLLVLRLR